MNISSLFKAILLLTVLALLNGCASQKDFVRPDKDAITLGKSTRDDVIKLVGQPLVEAGGEYNGEKIKTITYFYTESPAFWGMIIEKHSLLFTTLADVVVSSEYNSAYDKDKTKFDLDKIPQIKKGMTENEVVALMGQPSGYAIYPIVKDKTSRGILYAYSYARFAGILTSENNYLVLVTLDSTDKVSDVLYKKGGKIQAIN